MNINAKILRTLIIAVASALALVLYDRVHLIVAPLHLQRTLAVLIMHMIVCLPIVVVLLLLNRPKDFFRHLGLDGNFIKGMVFALISTLPLFIAFPVVGGFQRRADMGQTGAFRRYCGLFRRSDFPRLHFRATVPLLQNRFLVVGDYTIAAVRLNPSLPGQRPAFVARGFRSDVHRRFVFQLDIREVGF